MSELSQKHCLPCEGGVDPLSLEEARSLRTKLKPRWKLSEDGKSISAEFNFKNFYYTMAFINAVAYISIQEGHHPDVSFGYSNATMSYSTHAIGGLSENDFICAARVDALEN